MPIVKAASQRETHRLKKTVIKKINISVNTKSVNLQSGSIHDKFGKWSRGKFFHACTGF